MKLVGENLGEIVNIGLPILFLCVAIISFVWFAINVRNKKITFKSMFSWFILNTFFTACVVYILIVAILHFYKISDALNIFNLLATYAFGIELDNGKQWIVLLILAFILYILLKSLHNSIKIARLEHRVNDLNREVAILSGKINNTANFKKLPLAENALSTKEYRKILKEQVKTRKTEVKTKAKLDELDEISQEFELRKKG